MFIKTLWKRAWFSGRRITDTAVSWIMPMKRVFWKILKYLDIMGFNREDHTKGFVRQRGFSYSFCKYVSIDNFIKNVNKKG